MKPIKNTNERLCWQMFSVRRILLKGSCYLRESCCSCMQFIALQGQLLKKHDLLGSEHITKNKEKLLWKINILFQI